MGQMAMRRRAVLTSPDPSMEGLLKSNVLCCFVGVHRC